MQLGAQYDLPPDNSDYLETVRPHWQSTKQDLEALNPNMKIEELDIEYESWMENYLKMENGLIEFIIDF